MNLWQIIERQKHAFTLLQKVHFLQYWVENVQVHWTTEIVNTTLLLFGEVQ